MVALKKNSVIKFPEDERWRLLQAQGSSISPKLVTQKSFNFRLYSQSLSVIIFDKLIHDCYLL